MMDLIADFVCGETLVTSMMEMMKILGVEIKAKIIQLSGGAFSLLDILPGPNNPLEIICENVIFLLTGYDQ